VSYADLAEYNRYLISEVGGGSGMHAAHAHLRETYILALFNKNLKPGPITERNFGLFVLKKDRRFHRETSVARPV